MCLQFRITENKPSTKLDCKATTATTTNNNKRVFTKIKKQFAINFVVKKIFCKKIKLKLKCFTCTSKGKAVQRDCYFEVEQIINKTLFLVHSYAYIAQPYQ